MLNYRKQRYSACKLIAAINARIFLGKPDISERLFEELVDLTICRNGSALAVTKAYPILELDYKDNLTYDPTWVKEHLPVSLSIHDPIYGYHSVLIVSIDGSKVRLINSAMGTVSHEMLISLLPKWDHQFRCRSFFLKENS